jgi:hypothetical protein
MHKYLEFIKHNKEISSFALFVVITLTILTITLILVRTNQDTRSRAASGTCTIDEPLIIDLVEQEFLRILNAHRVSINVGELRLSQTLSKAAQWQTEDMIANNYRGHVDSTGRLAEQRLIDCGINGITAGENIVWSTVSAQDAFNKWMNSTGHKENIEKGSFSQIGISRMNEGGTWVWVNTFSSGNDGTTPDLEDPSTPTATPTESQIPTATPALTITTTPISPTLSPSPSPNLTPPASPREFNFSFRIPGIGPNVSIGQNPNPVDKDRFIIFLVVNSDESEALDFRFVNASYEPSTSLYRGTVVLDENTLLPDNFLWVFLSNSSVHKIIVKSLSTNNTIPTLLFRLGDFNLDQKFDLNDYIELIACIKKIRCTPHEGFFDLESNGIVDVVDLNILLRAIRDFNQ